MSNKLVWGIRQRNLMILNILIMLKYVIKFQFTFHKFKHMRIMLLIMCLSIISEFKILSSKLGVCHFLKFISGFCLSHHISKFFVAGHKKKCGWLVNLMMKIKVEDFAY